MNVSKYFERCLWYIGAELQKVSYRYFLFTCHGVWRKHRGNAADRHARFMSPVSTARTAPTWASRIHVRRLSPRGTWVHKLRGAVKWITWHTRSKPGLCHRPASCLSFGVSILMVSLIDLWIWGGPYANKQGFVFFFFHMNSNTDTQMAMFQVPGMNWRTSIFIFELKGFPAKLPYLEALEAEVILSCCPSRDEAGVGLAAVCSPYSPPVSCAHGRHHSSHITWDSTADPRQRSAHRSDLAQEGSHGETQSARCN